MTQRLAGQASLLDGGPLQFPEVLEWDLPRLLARASEGFQNHGIRFVDRHGAGSFLSYPALADEATRYLASLHHRGLRPGDRVLFQLEQPRELIPAFWACAMGGIVPAILPAVRSPDGRDVLARHFLDAWTRLDRPPILVASEAAAEADLGWAHVPRVIAMEHLREVLRTAGPPVAWHKSRPLDVAVLLRTSGSSGTPKLVKLSHRNILASVAGSSLQLQLGPQDVCLNWQPLCHVGALMRSIRDVYLQCQSVQAATSFVIEDPLRWLDLLDRHMATTTWGSDFAFGLVVDRLRRHPEGHHWDLHSLRSVCSSGEPVSQRTMTRFRELLGRYGLRSDSLHQAWGLTEACSATHSLDSSPDAGVPVPGMAVRIVDQAGVVVASGTQGQVQIRGAACASTEEWFSTQDLGSIADGRLHISARDGDWIIRNGKKFAAAEVEALLREGLDSDTACIAVSAVRKPGGDATYLAAFFEQRPNQELDQAAASRIQGVLARSTGISADYLVPVSRELLSRTSGKTPRVQLRALFEGGILPAVGVQPLRHGRGSETLNGRLIASIFFDTLAVNSVGLDDDFFALGGSSVQAAQAVNSLNSKFGLGSVNVNDMFRYPTARLMADFIYGEGGNSDPEKSGRQQADARCQAREGQERRRLARGAAR